MNLSTLNYILWQVQPEIIEGFRVRWYGLLFALGFIIGIQLFLRFFGKERNDGTDFNEKDTDKLIIYVILGVIVGARLGHCLFYEWDAYKDNLIEILMIQNGGLASHGGGIGLFIGLLLFLRKEKRFSFLWLLDRLALAVAISGCLIRFGNLMNSEIIGLPYDGPGAFAFVEETRRAVTSAENAQEEKYITDMMVEKTDAEKCINGFTYPGVKVTLSFNQKMSLEEIYRYLGDNKDLLEPRYKSSHKHFLKPNENYVVTPHTATVNTFMVTRHPAQLYESVTSLILFIILFAVYLKLRKNTPEGLLSGMFLIWIFTLRFFYEFIKENQVLDEATMSLNIGQRLSIPMVLFGIYLIYHSFKKKKKSAE